MTFSDEQDMKILKILIDNNGYLNYTDFNKLTKTLLGQGSFNVMTDMEKRGLIINHFTHPAKEWREDYQKMEQAYELTDVGRNKYASNIEEEKKEKLLRKVFIWTLIAAAVGAIAAIVSIFL